MESIAAGIWTRFFLDATFIDRLLNRTYDEAGTDLIDVVDDIPAVAITLVAASAG